MFNNRACVIALNERITFTRERLSGLYPKLSYWEKTHSVAPARSSSQIKAKGKGHVSFECVFSQLAYFLYSTPELEIDELTLMNHVDSAP